MNSELIHKLAATSKEAKEILEKEYPNEFIKSGWYVDGGAIIYRDFENGKAYGIHADRTWFYYEVNHRDCENTLERPAPPELVEQRLIEEAKRRGLVDGTSHKWSDLEVRDTVYPFSFNSEGNYLSGGFGYAIFHHGQWAEVIKEGKTHEATIVYHDSAGPRDNGEIEQGDSLKDYDNTPRINPEIFTPVKQTIDKVIDALTELKKQLP